MSHKFIRPGRAAILAVLLSALAYHKPARGQGTATTLLVELQNVVEYRVDTYDLSKFGTNPNVTKGDLMAGLAPDLVMQFKQALLEQYNLTLFVACQMAPSLEASHEAVNRRLGNRKNLKPVQTGWKPQ